jgi:hypothetical protein
LSTGSQRECVFADYLLVVVDPDVTGKVGQVIVRIRGAEYPGEVLVGVRGGTEAFIAYAHAPIELDTDVLVVSSRGERSVDVVPWPFPAELEDTDPSSG